MNWQQIEGRWREWKGTFRQQWAKLTDDDIDQIAGRKDRLLGKLQQRYGMGREQAEAKVDEWIGRLDEGKSSTKH